jgi:hypothetical protein
LRQIAARGNTAGACFTVVVICEEAALYEAGIRANLNAFVDMGELREAPALAPFLDTSFLGEAMWAGSTR